jgi:hypothetical protein
MDRVTWLIERCSASRCSRKPAKLCGVHCEWDVERVPAVGEAGNTPKGGIAGH